MADEEVLARFLTSSRHFSVQKQLVKPEAFLPAEAHRETSVFRHSGETGDALWKLGNNVVGNESGRRLHGAALLPAVAIRDVGLDVVGDEPPARHAAIRGWPWGDDPTLRKARHKEISAALASSANVLLLTAA